MEAKDTAMSPNQLDDIFYGKKGDLSDRKATVTFNLPEQLPYLEEQAEISFNAGKQEGRKEVVDLCLQAISIEPEFPDNMPEELWKQLNDNRENTTRAMRLSVRLTKQFITERIQAQLKKWGIEE